MERTTFQFLNGRRKEQFRALLWCLVPRVAQLSPGQQASSLMIVDGFLADAPYKLKKQIALFLDVIDLLSFFRGGSGFSNLSPEKQKRLMEWLLDNPFKVLRKGFWGVCTMAKMGVYGQPSVYPLLEYKLRELKNE